MRKPPITGNLFAAACLCLLSSAYSQGLREVVSYAQSRDPGLQSASLTSEAAKENVWIARSRLLPQLSYAETRQNTNQTTTQDTFFGPQVKDFAGQTYNKQISLRQGIIRPRDVEGYRQGHIQARYGEHKLASAKADLWSRTASAWLELLAARALVVAYGSAVKSVSEAARQESKRFELGDGTKDSRAEALAQFAQAKALLSDAQFNLKARERAYELLTGLNPKDLNDRKIPVEVVVKFGESQRDKLWTLILDSAPELQASQALQDVNLSRASQAQYDHLPTLDLVASVSSAQNDTANTLGYRYTNRLVGVQLVVPLFSGGGQEATRRQAYANYEASVADREFLLVRMENQFMADWASQAGLMEREQAARSLVVSAQELRRSVELGQAKGLKTWADLSNADLLLARRISDLVNLQVALFKSQARILALLPIQTPAWQEWVDSLDRASLQ